MVLMLILLVIGYLLFDSLSDRAPASFVYYTLVFYAAFAVSLSCLIFLVASQLKKAENLSFLKFYSVMCLVMVLAALVVAVVSIALIRGFDELSILEASKFLVPRFLFGTVVFVPIWWLIAKLISVGRVT